MELIFHEKEAQEFVRVSNSLNRQEIKFNVISDVEFDDDDWAHFITIIKINDKHIVRKKKGV